MDYNMTPEEAYDIGAAVGRYDAEMSAVKAFEMGETTLWVEWVTPKSWSEWEDWREKYGEDFENRWKV